MIENRAEVEGPRHGEVLGRKRSWNEIGEKSPVPLRAVSRRNDAVDAFRESYVKAQLVLDRRRSGDEAFRLCKFGAARDQYEEALELAVPWGEVSMKASMLFMKALACLHLGDWSEAQACLQKVVSLEPRWLKARCVLGFAFLRGGSVAKAHREFRCFLSLCRRRVKIDLGKASLSLTNDTSLRVRASKSSTEVFTYEALLVPFFAPYEAPPISPIGWVVKESRVKPGKVFFMHKATGRRQWDSPLVHGHPAIRRVLEKIQTASFFKPGDGEEEAGERIRRTTKGGG